jgi:hypothetical protein
LKKSTATKEYQRKEEADNEDVLFAASHSFRFSPGGSETALLIFPLKR